MISRQRLVWPYMSPGAATPPSGAMAVVPDTATYGPMRTAREKPIFGSKGDPEETSLRMSGVSSCVVWVLNAIAGRLYARRRA